MSDVSWKDHELAVPNVGSDVVFLHDPTTIVTFRGVAGRLRWEVVTRAGNFVTLPAQPWREAVRVTMEEAIAPQTKSISFEVNNEQSVPQGFATQVIETVRARGSAYGTPAENHQLTADLFSKWLSRRFKTPLALSAEDVIMLNVLQKCSRLAEVSKDDSWLDIAGYTENVAMIHPDQRNHRQHSKKLSEVSEPPVFGDFHQVSVNGKQVRVAKGQAFTYEEVVAWAGLTGQPSITFTCPKTPEHQGSVCPRSVYVPVDGAVLNIVHTNAA